MKGNRLTKSVVATALVAVMTLPAAALAAEFTGEYLFADGGTGMIYVKGADYRLDIVHEDGEKGFIIVNNTEGMLYVASIEKKAYQVMPAVNDFILYMLPFQAPQAGEKFSKLANSPYSIQVEGKGEVSGRECEQRALVFDTMQALQKQLTFCYSTELSFPIEVRDTSGTLEWGSVTVSNILKTSVSEDMLELPEGYTKAE